MYGMVVLLAMALSAETVAVEQAAVAPAATVEPLPAEPVEPIVVNPNRPTFAAPARTTQFGVAEIEWGWQQSFLRAKDRAFSTPTLLKFGLERDFELRLSTNGFLDLAKAGGASAVGMADMALGAQWCFTHDGLLGGDWAIQLTHKFATASARRGLGSGAADTTLGLFMSRDFGPNHVDVNIYDTWLGLPSANGGGSTHQPAGAVAVSHRLGGTWSFGGELYGIGGTAINSRVVSNLWYVAYQPSSRLVLDGGVDIGLSHGAQHYSIFTGLTWGIGRFRKP